MSNLTGRASLLCALPVSLTKKDNNTRCLFAFLFSVPSLSKARRQPTSYHVATSQEVQKPHNSRLQELGCGHYQYVASKAFFKSLATLVHHEIRKKKKAAYSCCLGFFLHEFMTCQNVYCISSKYFPKLFMYRQYASKSRAICAIQMHTKIQLMPL